MPRKEGFCCFHVIFGDSEDFVEAGDFLYKPKNRVWKKSFFHRSTKTKKKTLVANPTFLGKSHFV